MTPVALLMRQKDNDVLYSQGGELECAFSDKPTNLQAN